MVVVVADAILEAGGGAGRLDASDDTFGDQQTECVVDRLQRDGPNLGPDDRGDDISGDMRLIGDSPQNGEALRGHLNSALTKEISRIGGHQNNISTI